MASDAAPASLILQQAARKAVAPKVGANRGLDRWRRDQFGATSGGGNALQEQWKALV